MDNIFGSFDHASQIKDFVPKGRVSGVENRVKNLFEDDDEDDLPQPQPKQISNQNPTVTQPSQPVETTIAQVPSMLNPFSQPATTKLPAPAKSTSSSLFDEDDFVPKTPLPLYSAPKKNNFTSDMDQFKIKPAPQNPTPAPVTPQPQPKPQTKVAHTDPFTDSPLKDTKGKSSSLFDEDEVFTPQKPKVDIFATKSKFDPPTNKPTQQKTFLEEDAHLYAKSSMDTFFSGKRVEILPTLTPMEESVQETFQPAPVTPISTKPVATPAAVFAVPKPQPQPKPVLPPVDTLKEELEKASRKTNKVAVPLFDDEGSDDENAPLATGPIVMDNFFELKPKSKDLDIFSQNLMNKQKEGSPPKDPVHTPQELPPADPFQESTHPVSIPVAVSVPPVQQIQQPEPILAQNHDEDPFSETELVRSPQTTRNESLFTEGEDLSPLKPISNGLGNLFESSKKQDNQSNSPLSHLFTATPIAKKPVKVEAPKIDPLDDHREEPIVTKHETTALEDDPFAETPIKATPAPAVVEVAQVQPIEAPAPVAQQAPSEPPKPVVNTQEDSESEDESFLVSSAPNLSNLFEAPTKQKPNAAANIFETPTITKPIVKDPVLQIVPEPTPVRVTPSLSIQPQPEPTQPVAIPIPIDPFVENIQSTPNEPVTQPITNNVSKPSEDDPFDDGTDVFSNPTLTINASSLFTPPSSSPSSSISNLFGESASLKTKSNTSSLSHLFDAPSKVSPSSSKKNNVPLLDSAHEDEVDPFVVAQTPTTKKQDDISFDFVAPAVTPTVSPVVPQKSTEDELFSPSNGPLMSPSVSPLQSSTPAGSQSPNPNEASQDYNVFDILPPSSAFTWTTDLKSYLPQISFIQLSETEVRGLVSFTYSRHDGQTVNHHVSDREKAIMREYERRIDVEIKKMGGCKVVVSVNFAAPRDSVRLKNERAESSLRTLCQNFASEKGARALNDNYRLVLLTDAFNNACHVSNGKEAIELIRKSSFVKNELKQALVASTSPEVYFVVRKAEAYSSQSEFYGFCNNTPTSVVQFHESCFFQELKVAKATTQEQLSRFMSSIRSKAPDPTFYVHFALLADNSCRILDYVPLPKGSPQLINFPSLFGKQINTLLTGPFQLIIREAPLLPSEPKPSIMSKNWSDVFTKIEASLPKTNASGATGGANDENCCIQ